MNTASVLAQLFSVKNKTPFKKNARTIYKCNYQRKKKKTLQMNTPPMNCSFSWFLLLVSHTSFEFQKGSGSGVFLERARCVLRPSVLATSVPLVEQFSLTSRLWKSALSQTLAICVQAPSPPCPPPSLFHSHPDCSRSRCKTRAHCFHWSPSACVP